MADFYIRCVADHHELVIDLLTVIFYHLLENNFNIKAGLDENDYEFTLMPSCLMRPDSMF
jgi:hypothetical protein